MAEQLRKIQQDAYYNFMKAVSITDLPMMSFMVRLRRLLRAAAVCLLRRLTCAAAAQERERLFTTLRNGLNISPEQHTATLSKLDQETDSVNRIR